MSDNIEGILPKILLFCTVLAPATAETCGQVKCLKRQTGARSIGSEQGAVHKRQGGEEERGKEVGQQLGGKELYNIKKCETTTEILTEISS